MIHQGSVDGVLRVMSNAAFLFNLVLCAAAKKDHGPGNLFIVSADVSAYLFHKFQMVFDLACLTLIKHSYFLKGPGYG